MPVPKALKALQGVDMKLIKSKQQAYETSFLNIPRTDPWVPILLRDREFKLEYSYSAAQEVMRLTNKNIFAGELKAEDLGDMTMLVGVLLCGLHTHHADVTDEEIGKLLTLKHRMYYVHCISKAMEVTQPDYDQLQDIIGDIQSMTAKLAELEEDDENVPLVETPHLPISGEPAA